MPEAAAAVKVDTNAEAKAQAAKAIAAKKAPQKTHTEKLVEGRPEPAKADEGTKGDAADDSADAGKQGADKAGAKAAEASDTKTEESDSLLGGGAKATDAADDIEIKLPEGVSADAVSLAEFKPLAKKLGLKSDAAQELVDLSIRMQKQAVEKWQSTVKEWRQAAKQDKEYGGEHFKENLATAKDALNKFFSPKAVAALDAAGLTDHPEVIRGFVKLGKANKEDTIKDPDARLGGPPDGDKAKGPTGDPLIRLYTKMGSKTK